MTPQEVRDARKYFLTHCERKTLIKKGDRRVMGNRICGICHEKLSTVEAYMGKSSAIRDHYSCYMSELYTVNICRDSKLCQKNIKREGEI